MERIESENTQDLFFERAEELNRLSSENEALKLEIEHLKEQYNLLRSILFGKSSEKSKIHPIDCHQPSLFDEPKGSNDQPPAEPSETISVGGHTRKKPGRKPIPDHFERVDIVHEKSPEEIILDCGCWWERIGEKITEQLDIIPAKIRVLRNIRVQYALRPPKGTEFCEVHDSIDNEQGPMDLAPMPPQIIHQGIVSPGLLAHVITAKYVDAIPLYRQEQQFQRLGLDISRGTLCNWVLLVAQACARLLGLLFEEILRGPVIFMDETPIQVLNEPGRKNTTKSYMWVCRGGPPEAPCLLFRYAPTRDSSMPLEILEGFRGYLQTDGYKGYDLIGNRDGILHVGCWAHVRRKFIEVTKGTKGTLKTGVAQTMVDHIQSLYQIEHEARAQGLTTEQVAEFRAARSKPILEEIKEFLDEKAPKVPPKSLLGKAIAYARNQWPRLQVFLDDGEIRLDNNLAENAIRPFVVGRKNWLFSGSPRGAAASAALYSLIETAKANGIEPYAYLRLIFTELPKATSDDEIRTLLPQHLDRSRLNP